MENDKTHRKHHISKILNSNIFNRSFTGVEMGTIKVRSHRLPYRNATQRNASQCIQCEHSAYSTCFITAVPHDAVIKHFE